MTRVESRPPFAPVALADGTRFQGWREFVRIAAETVRVELESADGHPAWIVNGRVLYLAGRPDEALADNVVRHLMDDAGLTAHALHRDVRIRDNGDLRYVFNYGPETVDVSDLVEDHAIVLGAAALEPRGVLVLRRRR